MSEPSEACLQQASSGCTKGPTPEEKMQDAALKRRRYKGKIAGKSRRAAKNCLRRQASPLRYRRGKIAPQRPQGCEDFATALQDILMRRWWCWRWWTLVGRGGRVFRGGLRGC